MEEKIILKDFLKENLTGENYKEYSEKANRLYNNCISKNIENLQNIFDPILTKLENNYIDMLLDELLDHIGEFEDSYYSETSFDTAQQIINLTWQKNKPKNSTTESPITLLQTAYISSRKDLKYMVFLIGNGIGVEANSDNGNRFSWQQIDNEIII